MWLCRKCSKPVFFAERKQSVGFDWHPNCLRCEECGKRLNPGQHAEHKGIPYCHHPCYGALFGPQLFGHGTRNECHTSFGKVENRDGQIKRSHLESQLKLYNNFYEGKPGELKSREVNGRLMLEGVLRIYWGVSNTIHLKEEDDSRMIATRRKSCAENRGHSSFCSDSDDDDPRWRDESPNRDLNRQHLNPERRVNSQNSTVEDSERDTVNVNGNDREADSLSTSARASDSVGNSLNNDKYSSSMDTNGQANCSSPTRISSNYVNNNGLSERQERSSYRSGSTAIRRRPGRRMEKSRLKRRCSINGHFYLRETSSFTPPYGSPCSIWITSKTTAEEVLNMLLEKYKVEMSASNFALFVVKDTGELRRIREDESPLISRVMLGPHEEVAKVFIMDAQRTHEISQEVAQFLNLSLTECRSILTKYEQEEMKYLKVIKKKYENMRRFMRQKIDEDKVEIRINGF